MNWSSIVDRQLSVGGSGAIVYLEGGQVLRFGVSGSTFTPSTGGRTDTLVQNSSTTWTWTSEAGDKTLFTQATSSAPMLVTSITEIGGHVLTFNYNSSNILQSISDELGRTATITWSSTHQISQIAFPDGVTFTYNYTQITSGFGGQRVNNLTSVQRTQSAVTRTVTYKYEDTTFPEALTGIVDERGVRTVTWVYDDANARVSSSQQAGTVGLTSVTYNDTAMTRTVTNPLGKQQTYTFATVTGRLVPTQIAGAASTHTPATTATKTYSTAGFLATDTDANSHQTTYTQNTQGFEVSRTEAYGTSAARTITTAWSTTLPLPTQITEPGRTTAFVYDTNGNVTSRTVTDTTSYTTPYATNGRTRTWTYAYTTQGLLHTVTDPLTHTTTYAYNSSGFLSSVTDALSHVTTITAWNGRGKPLTAVDPNGVTTTFTYDIDDRPLVITINPGASQSQYTLAYTAAGDISQITLPVGGYLQYAYDNSRRLTSVTDNVGNSQTYAYDNNSDPLSRTVKNASSTVTKLQSTTYDELGRILTGIGASSQTWTFAYDLVGNKTSVTDPLSHVRQTAFDALNRAITDTDPLSHTVQYAFDPRDNLTQLTDGRALATTREVDGFGKIIQEISPDRATRQYWYDAAGNLTKWIDGDGEETDFTYDALNRRASKTFPTSSAENLTYTYDQTTGGNAGIGRLTSVTDQPGSTSLVYDAQGRMTGYNKVIWGRSYPLTYAYDVNGKVTQITYPSGRIVNITRDSRGQVTTVTTKLNSGATAQNVATSVNYAPFGPLTGFTYGNGLNLTRTYDQDYHLTRIQVNATGITRLDLGFQWYNDGRMGEVDDNAATGRTTYIGYYNDGRLWYANGPWGQETYTYDNAGGRIGDFLTVGGVTTTHNEVTWGTSNRLADVTNSSWVITRNFGWRAGGDMSNDQVVGGPAYVYYYNARKRLSGLTSNGTTVGTYAYDAFDRRVVRQTYGTGAGVTQYTFDPSGNLLAENDGATGNVLREYVWLDNLPVAMIDSTSGSAVAYYIHTGQMDEPLELTDASKALAWNAYVNPYGQAQTFSTASETIALRLPGQWLQLEANGLHQNGYRDYDPSIGRYVQADPLGIYAGQNLYQYAGGDPLDLRDPSGRNPFAAAAVAGCVADVETGCAPGAAAAIALIAIGIGIESLLTPRPEICLITPPKPTDPKNLPKGSFPGSTPMVGTPSPMPPPEPPEKKGFVQAMIDLISNWTDPS